MNDGTFTIYGIAIAGIVLGFALGWFSAFFIVWRHERRQIRGKMW